MEIIDDNWTKVKFFMGNILNAGRSLIFK